MITMVAEVRIMNAAEMVVRTRRKVEVEITREIENMLDEDKAMVVITDNCFVKFVYHMHLISMLFCINYHSRLYFAKWVLVQNMF